MVEGCRPIREFLWSRSREGKHMICRRKSSSIGRLLAEISFEKKPDETREDRPIERAMRMKSGALCLALPSDWSLEATEGGLRLLLGWCQGYLWPLAAQLSINLMSYSPHPTYSPKTSHHRDLPCLVANNYARCAARQQYTKRKRKAVVDAHLRRRQRDMLATPR